MNILVLKLILAPVIIGSASLAGRKWGPAVSGWIVGMPLTSGPVIFFVALSHDATFAYNASLGTLSGGFSLVAFCLVYAWLALRFNRQPERATARKLFFCTLAYLPLILIVTVLAWKR